MHPGQRIGKYVLGERIAVGGMAEVWAARAEGPEGFVKPVALKVILESFSGDPELEKLFIKEARIAAQLQHANLVSVFDFDKVVTGASEPGTGGRYYIAMEHVEGYDARRVAQAARHAGYLFPLPLALYLAGEVMKGLRYVHERRDGGRPLGLVHRDVSPHNVLVGFSGEVKLSDFGIAKSLAHSSRTKTGTIRGKIAYASPEQLSAGPVDHRTDQFAMGITLWEILADRPLFDGHNELEIIGQVMRCEVPPLALANPEREVPSAVEAVVRKMLARAREDRYPTTADALAALLRLPGYSADGNALGELVRTLFHRGTGELASTTPIQDPAAQARLGVAGIKRPPAGAGVPLPARPSPAVAAPPPSAVATKTLARPQGRGARPRGASGTRPDETPPTVRARVQAAPRRPRLVQAAVAAAVMVAVAVVIAVAIASRAPALDPEEGGARLAAPPPALGPPRDSPPAPRGAEARVPAPSSPAAFAAPDDLSRAALRHRGAATEEPAAPREAPASSPAPPPPVAPSPSAPAPPPATAAGARPAANGAPIVE